MMSELSQPSDDAEKLALTIDCAYCGAPAGSACEWPLAWDRTHAHDTRVIDALPMTGKETR